MWGYTILYLLVIDAATKEWRKCRNRGGSNSVGLQELGKVSTRRCHLKYVLKKEQEFAGLKRVRREGTPHAKAQRHERIQCIYLGSSKKFMARVSRNIVSDGAGEIMWC